MRIKHSTMVRPGVAYYFHAWDPTQFPDHKSFKWLIPGTDESTPHGRRAGTHPLRHQPPRVGLLHPGHPHRHPTLSTSDTIRPRGQETRGGAACRKLRAPPKASTRQLGMVMDLNKCLGCQTCTVACKKLWNQGYGNPDTRTGTTSRHSPVAATRRIGAVQGRPQRFGRGEAEVSFRRLIAAYGRAWEFNHQETFASGGKPAEQKTWLRPEGRPKWGPNWDEDHGAGKYPEDNHYFYLPRICNHCTHPACLDACPRSAIYKEAQERNRPGGSE